MVSPSATRLAGRYELRRPMAETADATLWDGFDAALQRRVRVRLLRPELAADAAARERFGRAARTAARTAAPAGERILDAGEDRQVGLPFVVLEWSDASAHAETLAESDAPTQRLPIVDDVGGGRRPPQPPRLQRLALGLLLIVPVVLGAVLVRAVLDQPSALQATLSTLGARPPAATAAATAPPGPASPTAPPATATPRPAATPVPTAVRTSGVQTAGGQTASTPTGGVRRRIVNTDGQGVALRASAGGQRLPGKGYDEGVTVTVLEQDGAWAHIRGDDGREGWILAVTLGS